MTSPYIGLSILMTVIKNSLPTIQVIEPNFPLELSHCDA